MNKIKLHIEKTVFSLKKKKRLADYIYMRRYAEKKKELTSACLKCLLLNQGTEAIE